MGGASGDVAIFFERLSMKDVASVGGKNASLGEMYRQLRPLGVRVPNGFAVHIDAFRASLSRKDLDALHAVLDPLDKSDSDFVHKLAIAGQKCRDIVYKAELTPEHTERILEAYRKLTAEYEDSSGLGVSVAVRSSATAEDLPSASFAGQHDTYLNIRGEAQLIQAIKRCNASLFTDRAISYRMDQGFDHFKVFLSTGVMKMVRSDLASSGVMFSIDTETGFKDAVFITASVGLGENVVLGNVDPDEFFVHKPTFRKGARAVLRRRLGRKQVKMVFSLGTTREPVRNTPTPVNERESYCLTDEQVMELADCAIKIEDHYSAINGHLSPMDIEWALDGVDHKLYIVQARPETVASQKSLVKIEQYDIKPSGFEVITTGRAVGTKVSTGTVRVIHSTEELQRFTKGEILVSDTTTPDWEPIMKMASGIITARGGRTCHASIVARELGITAVVGAEDALHKLKTGDSITISCAEGDVGRVYRGIVPHEMVSVDLGAMPKLKTKLMINLGNPELAFSLSFLPCDGIGLARMEFIINEYIKVHPMALLHPERVVHVNDYEIIKRLTRNFKSGADFMVQTLSEGLGTLAAGFYPRDVVVRLSDFKTNEYSKLIGGSAFEPKEENPMIGWRGASRYAHPNYAEGFALECAAIARVREQMGLTNVIVMIPFVRTVKEAENVLAYMASKGLPRGSNGLKVYFMCEIPNNVIQIDAFLALFDGFSIGSNDLTQLTLGCDRDSALVSDLFDERDPGVQTLLKWAIEGAKRCKKHSGICGQAPSDYPEVAQFLIEQGIESISLVPDSLLKTIVAVNAIEKRLASK